MSEKAQSCCGPGPLIGLEMVAAVPPELSREEALQQMQATTSVLGWKERWDHLAARFGIRRGDHRVNPGLYALGNPGPQAPVLVTANYTLSFDALRAALGARDAYILVLNTQGINVWCAAGKGTFGTQELIRRIQQTGLRQVIEHNTLILPQLGAPGVSAHQVTRATKFKIKYGPVRAADLPEYLARGAATAEMRRVRFPLLDRLVLIPVDLVQVLLPAIAGGLAAFFIGGLIVALAALFAFFAGAVLFPLLLPWLPTRHFSTKGWVLGAAVTLPFALGLLLGDPQPAALTTWLLALGIMLILPTVTAYLGLNFTGATTFTSRTGVRREIFRYIPMMGWMAGIGLLLTLAGGIGSRLGVLL